jgi:hypothetical protein
MIEGTSWSIPLCQREVPGPEADRALGWQLVDDAPLSSSSSLPSSLCLVRLSSITDATTCRRSPTLIRLAACMCRLLPVDGARKEAAGVWLMWEQTVLVRGE